MNNNDSNILAGIKKQEEKYTIAKIVGIFMASEVRKVPYLRQKQLATEAEKSYN